MNKLIEQLPRTAQAMGRQIAAACSESGPDEALIFWSALLYLHLQEGRVCLPVNNPFEGLDLDIADGEIDVSLPPPPCPLTQRDDGTLWLPRYDAYDIELRRLINERRNRHPRTYDEQTLRAAFDNLFPQGVDDKDSYGQQLAVAALVDLAFGLLTGGPGTGKTSSIANLLALHLRLHAEGPPARILLLAPTGKAAQRLREGLKNTIQRLRESAVAANTGVFNRLDPDHEDCCVETMTIHRALSPRRFRDENSGPFWHDQENPVTASFVIVDEVSMVDLALMTRLFTAIPASIPILLLGDAQQLESVEAGSVLAQLAQEHTPPDSERRDQVLNRCGLCLEDVNDCWPSANHVHLTHNYRFGKNPVIGELAKAIQEGNATAFLEVLQSDENHKQARWIHLPDEGRMQPDKAKKIVQFGYADVWAAANDLNSPRKPDVLAKFDTFRVLCATRKGPDGAQAWNRRIQEWITAANGPQSIRAVMITANNPDTGLYNGDTGLVLANESAPPLFHSSDGNVVLPEAMLPAHEPGWAMTIHKSQGSEYDHVFIVLPRLGAKALLNRRLLYTAITRARERITLVATEQAIRDAVKG